MTTNSLKAEPFTFPNPLSLTSIHSPNKTQPFQNPNPFLLLSSSSSMASTTLLDAESKTKSIHQLYSTYLGISFAVFLSFLPQSALSFLPTLQSRNQFIHHRLRRAEEELTQLRSRRQEDSKANARVVEIFATHRNAWQQEERRLLRRLDELSEEIARLRSRVSDLEAHECQLINEIDELRRGVGERDEMINFMSRHHSVDGDGGGGGGGSGGGDGWGCGGEDVGGVKLMSGGEFDGFDGSYLSSSPSKLWQQAGDPSEPGLGPEFRSQRQTEFLLEAFQLQQRASETGKKLGPLQTEIYSSDIGDELGVETKIAMRRSLDTIRSNFKEIQRNLEIWLARIMGDLERILAREGASRVRDYYYPRYPYDK